MRELTIGEAARSAGVGIETIRFYQRRGLIALPTKPQGRGFRIYSPDEIKRIRFIRQAQQIGFSLQEIEELLALRADPAADCSTVRAQALAKLDEVHDKIEQLRRIGSALEALIARCPGSGGLEACSILDTLVEPGPPIAASGPLPAAPPKRRRRSGTSGPGRRPRRVG
jgi:MerR family mercuric resistance operon transcriptional regulator